MVVYKNIEMKASEKVTILAEIPIEQAKPIMLAVAGKPYFLLVREKGKCYNSSMTQDFDLGALFHWLILHAREDKEFRNRLADYVIDLSKEI